LDIKTPQQDAEVFFFFWSNLYRSDYESTAEFGETYEMGLPLPGRGFTAFRVLYLKQQADFRKNYYPCGFEVGWDLFPGIYYFGNNKTDWKPSALKHRENTVVMADKNCNPANVRILCQFCSKRSIGITLTGQIKDRVNSEWHFNDQNFYLR
jgi:hypothetical protein